MHHALGAFSFILLLTITVSRLRLQFYSPAVTIVTFHFNRMFIPPIYVFIFWRQDRKTWMKRRKNNTAIFLSMKC